MTQIVFLVKITPITGMGNNMQQASLMSQDFPAFFTFLEAIINSYCSYKNKFMSSAAVLSNITAIHMC